VLYLLHGLSDDDTAWTRYTSIERYAAERGLAVVMPQVHRSFYADERHGARFWTFLSTELPTIVAALFRVSERRADTFVAGLSMGGYGALKWALRQPERFAAAASLSGALDIPGRAPGSLPPHVRETLDRIFGAATIAGTDDDLLHLARSADPQTLPPLYLACGTDDHLYGDNQRFRAAVDERGLDLTVDFGPGDHEWGYWDEQIRHVLDWLPLRA
jgi:S-formylglutathione hydrolase FrmB